MSRIVAIDPGTDESAVIEWFDGRVLTHLIIPNCDVFRFMLPGVCRVFCEMIASYGLPVGREVFETCLWIGEYRKHCKSAGVPFALVYRRDVKLHHCGSARAKDANVRQALIDKYGAPGKKSNPGTTYGLKSHLWQAFAIATMVTEQEAK